jgi:hypothetical protein
MSLSMTPTTLALRLSGLSEARQRARVLAELVRPGSAAEVIRLLADTLEGVGGGGAHLQVVLDAFFIALDENLFSEEARAALAAMAGQSGADGLEPILAPTASPTLRSSDGRQGSLASTLGMRKWLARRATGTLLDRLLVDPDGLVVANLLQNPRLTEAEVLRLVTRRPNSPEVIAAVGRAPRWNARYAVRRAIVFNPHTPLAWALRQLPFLRATDLRLVATEPLLPEEVRREASELAAARRSDRTPVSVPIVPRAATEGELPTWEIEGDEDDPES